jgi:hypothetical protein
MPRAKRVCSQPGCPHLTDSGRCDEHRKQADRDRGTRQQRGYGNDHDRGRAQAVRQATAGTPCARCHHPLGPDYRGAHYDHTDDRTGYLGLSHPGCNVSAGGKAAHR